MGILKKIIILIFFIVSFLWLTKVFFLGNYIDFNSFYFATRAYFLDLNPYGQLSGTLVGFLYPPTSFIFFSPFLFFSLNIASVLWTISSVGLLVASIMILFRIAKRKILSIEFLGILGVVFMMFPVKFSLGMGQVSILNLFLITHFLYYMSQKKEKLSGIFLSLSLLLKFSPILIPFHLILLRRWKVLVSMCIFSLVIVIAMYVYRPDQMILFLTNSLPGTFSTWPLAYYNQAFSGMIGRWLGKDELAQLIKLVTVIFTVILTAFVLWKRRKNKTVEQLAFVSLLPLSLLIAPLAWQHYFVLVIPTLVTLYFCYTRKKTHNIKYILLVLSYLLIASNSKNPSSFPLIIQSHVLWGAMLLWGLSLWEVWSITRKEKYE